MKKQLINEAFRLQQLAGIKPVNTLNENTPGFHEFMDVVDSMFKVGTPEHAKLSKAVEKALDNSELEVNQYGVDNAHGQVKKIAKEIGLIKEYEKGSDKHLNEITEGISIEDAFKKAGVDMQAVTFAEVDYGMGGDSEKYNSAQELLNKLNNLVDESEEEGDDADIWFEFKGEIVPWWDESEYTGREALLTVNLGDNASYAIIQ